MSSSDTGKFDISKDKINLTDTGTNCVIVENKPDGFCFYHAVVRFMYYNKKYFSEKPIFDSVPEKKIYYLDFSNINIPKRLTKILNYQI